MTTTGLGEHIAGEDERDRLEYTCAACGYGAVAATPPLACPMCRRRGWRLAPRADAVLSVKRVGDSTFVVAPRGMLAAETTLALAELVAALASERPDVVLDLTGTGLPDEATTALLPRLAAVAQAAGGRLLTASSSVDSEWLELRAPGKDRPLAAGRSGRGAGR